MGCTVDSQCQPRHHRHPGRGQSRPQLHRHRRPSRGAAAGSDYGHRRHIALEDPAAPEQHRRRVDIGEQPERMARVVRRRRPGVKLLEPLGHSVEFHCTGVGPPLGAEPCVGHRVPHRPPAHTVPCFIGAHAVQKPLKPPRAGAGQRGDGRCASSAAGLAQDVDARVRQGGLRRQGVVALTHGQAPTCRRRACGARGRHAHRRPAAPRRRRRDRGWCGPLSAPASVPWR